MADTATETARRILRLREEHRELIRNKVRGAVNALHLLDHLFEQPMVSVGRVAELVGVSFPTANSFVSQLAERALLREISGSTRNRLFAYQQYLDLFQPSSLTASQPASVQPTVYMESET